MEKKTLRHKLGEECKKLRKSAKLSQQALADSLNEKGIGLSFYREDISAFERTGEKLGFEKCLDLDGMFLEFS